MQHHSDKAAVRIEPADPSSADARAILRSYYVELVARHHGRAAEHDEVDRAMADEPSDDLRDETGLLVLARDESGRVLGCGGVRYIDPRAAELTRIFVVPAGRGAGIGTLVVRELERRTALSGRGTVRLDTRSDLVEARRLYARLGYREVPAFNADPYAQHWLAKTLAPTA